MRKFAAAVFAAMLFVSVSSCTDKGEMRDISTPELVSEMKVGWNLGDTLDVCAADRDGDGKVNEAPGEGESVDETLWGNIKTTPDLFEKLKAEGKFH